MIAEATEMTAAEKIRAERRASRIAGLRAALKLLEESPELPCPFIGDLYLFPANKEEFLHWRRLCGANIKNSDDQHLRFEKVLSPVSKLVICLEHEQVCERVCVGERTLPAEPERVIEAKPERVEPIYEWRCPESVLSTD